MRSYLFSLAITAFFISYGCSQNQTTQPKEKRTAATFSILQGAESW